ncbi:MAG TPA: NusG domain II-containing protein [Mobilitalea sp.]|nr:NusG domain II-containing protein [Mobilitalea sp.]
MKKNDLYLIAGILLLILISYLLLQIFKSEGSKVIVTIDGKEYKTFSLNDDTVYTIRQEDGQWNTFEIKDGYVKMLEASCPDKLCVKFHKIHYNDESITCLPNRVVIRISGGEESDIDAIAN